MAELLAKPDQSLLKHTDLVLRIGQNLAEQLNLPESLRVKALLACALHDVGKATESFQDYIAQGGASRSHRQVYPHALASLPAILLAEHTAGQRLGWDAVNLHATAAVLSHHSPLGAEVYKGYAAVRYHPQGKEVLEQIWALLHEIVPSLPSFEEAFSQWDTLSSQQLGALLDTPIFQRQGRNVSLRGVFQQLPQEEFAQVKTVLHLADWLASSGREAVDDLFLQGGRQQVTLSMSRSGVVAWRAFQQQCARTSSNILWLRAPTGTGKTEALLLWAGDARRIIYLLPTQATVNAMWRRLQNVFGQENVGIAHGRASYVMRQESSSDEDVFDERLFSSVFAKPVTVATLDQYLLAHLNGRHWEERRTLARQSALVIDEIHTYEPYTLGMLMEALTREPPAQLALASATLPNSLLRLFPAGETVEAEQNLWERKRHRLILREKPLAQGVEEAIESAKQGKKVLVVANTVAQAQDIYRCLKEQYGWQPLHLLHAHFILRDRQEKERQVQEPVPGTIFVSTQVVEVSLDIDYDVLITEMAPIDALVQRMGRVNRRGERPPAPVYLFTVWGQGAEKVYGKEVLQSSLSLLRELPELPTDRFLAEATERLYQQVTASAEWQEELQEGMTTLSEVQRILGCYTIDLSDEEMRQRFTARRGVVSVEVIPEQFVQEAYKMREAGEGWRLVELLVPVPIYWLSKFRDAFCPSADLGVYVSSLEYNPHEGLLERPSAAKAMLA
ncbi:MAG: CRISPR-associated helicase Cas3' [Armatimonadota bacterium]|nr:CRISPR-associated helicase Cas3' [bacterium]MDW8289517.1 CRISPR-associated helicase Cas3' [Armatimonadota bacterium]